jgi:hypothetical protein
MNPDRVREVLQKYLTQEEELMDKAAEVGNAMSCSYHQLVHRRLRHISKELQLELVESE